MRQQANDAGINSEPPDLMCDWVKRAQKAGYGSQETVAVIKVIRQGAYPPYCKEYLHCGL